MSKSWRPSDRIKVKAIGIVWRGDYLLVGEVHNDDGAVKGYRPLGGSVEFGEPWQEALKREFREELGVEVLLTKNLGTLENIFEHEGSLGHEIVFIGQIELPTGAYPGFEPFMFRESNGQECSARWITKRELDASGLALYPAGLGNLLFPQE